METAGSLARSAPAPGDPDALDSLADTPRSEKDLHWLAAIVDSSADAIIAKTLDGKIEAWNTAAERLYGYTAAEAIGRSTSMLVPPEARDEYEQVMERVRRGESVKTFETVRVRKGGLRVYVSLTLSPIGNGEGRMSGVAVVARDITKRKLREAEILNAGEQLRAILNTAADAIVNIDDRGLIQLLNPATEWIFGYTTPELIGQNIQLLIPSPHDLVHNWRRLRGMRSGEKRVRGVGRDARGRRKDGTFFAVELSVGEVDPGKLFTYVIRDISERKILEKELNESDRLAAIGGMARGIAHDLDNLLYTFRIATNSLEKCLTAPEGVEAVRSLQATTDYLRDLTHGLRQAAMDSQQQGLFAAPTTALADWWPAASALFYAVTPPGVSLATRIPSDLPAVQISPHLLTQIVFNLVSNATAALDDTSPADGSAVMISAALNPDGGGVRLQVADNGKGMPPEVLARAFEPYFTSRSGRRGEKLGLALVKKLVTEAGGEVSIESSPGAGTTVTIDLRAAPAEAEPSEARADGQGAALALADGRAAAILRVVLEDLGAQVRNDNDPDRAHIWIVDSKGADVSEVQRWRAACPHRRLVLVGRPDPGDAAAWDDLRPLKIDDPDDFDDLYTTIERAVMEE